MTEGITVQKKGKKYFIPNSVIAKNVKTDDEHLFITRKEKEALVKKDALGDAAYKGISNAVNSTSDKTVATSGAVAAVNEKVDGATSQIGDSIITYEGGHYYMQWGADTASKKRLGRSVSDWTVIAEDEFAVGQFDSPAATVQVEKQYDIKQYAADYASLTAADFYVTVTSVKTAAQIIHSGFDNISYSHGIKNYDAATGILTVFADTWQMTDINLLKGTYLKQTLKIFLCG